MTGIKLFFKMIGMTAINNIINFLKTIGYLIISWHVNFANNEVVINVEPSLIFCMCCSNKVETICNKFRVVLCDNCKEHFAVMNMINNGHGLFVPYKAMII